MTWLILTRRAGQRLSIGSDISVKIIAIGGSHVRLAIDAPAELAILRDEAHQRESTPYRRAVRAAGAQIGEAHARSRS
jgi:carbon storage regulator